MAKDWNPQYPGDEVVWKSINAVLQDACEEKGTTLDKVYKEVSRKEPPGHLRRVIGINLRNAREKVGLTREQVSKRSKVPVRRVILIEQGRTGRWLPRMGEDRLCARNKNRRNSLRLRKRLRRS